MLSPVVYALVLSSLPDLLLCDCLVFACGSAIPMLLRFSTMSPASGASSSVTAIPVSVGGSCSTRAMKLASGSGKRPSFKQRVLMITHGEKLSTAVMQEVVQISSTGSATVLSPTPLHVHPPFEADASDISGSPFIVDAPSRGGSNNFDCFHEQSDKQLLPTSHEPPTKKRKNPKECTS